MASKKRISTWLRNYGTCDETYVFIKLDALYFNIHNQLIILGLEIALLINPR